MMTIKSTHASDAAIWTSTQVRCNTLTRPQNLPNSSNKMKHQPAYSSDIESMQRMAQMLTDYAKDFRTLLNQLNGYKSEVMRLQQENQKLRLQILQPDNDDCLMTKNKKGWHRKMRTWQNREIVRHLEEKNALSYDNYQKEMKLIGEKPVSYKQFRFEYLKEKNLVDIGVMTNDKLIQMFYDKGIKPSECYRKIKQQYGDNPDIKIPCKRTVERYYEKMANLFDNQRKSCTFAV